MRGSKGLTSPGRSRYKRVQVEALNRGRKGKHHELVSGIIAELRTSPLGAALEIPMADVGGIGLPNLRSAVHRASAAAGIPIGTLADGSYFYVWKKQPSTNS